MEVVSAGPPITQLLTPDLVRSFAVFLLQTLASWGLGDVIVSTLWQARPGQSRLTRPLLALATGSGVLGQCLFMAGIAGDAYQPSIVVIALILGAGLSIFRLRPGAFRLALQVPAGIGMAGWVVLAWVCF